jgi:hypothetical protein
MPVRLGNVQGFSLIDEETQRDFMEHGHFSFVSLLQRVLFQLLFQAQAETQGQREGSH